MLLVLILTITQIVYIDTIETTPPVSITFDGFTLESWNEQLIWNRTQISLVHHLNEFCKNDIDCDAEYDINHIHLLDIIQCGLSSICLNITIDKPDTNMYNYTALLIGALFQTKIDVEYLHDNQLLNTTIYSSTSTHQNSVVNRTSRFLLVLLGITIVAIIFALTLFFFQKLRQYEYSKLFKTRETSQQTNEELLSSSQLTTVFV